MSTPSDRDATARPTPAPIAGIHHVTAIARDPQTNVDFYAGLLGLRLVKKTVNFDDPGTYHLYYGDESGRPGTILTFFPWPRARGGTRGVGQTTAIALQVPEGAMGYWGDRLRAAGAAVIDAARERGDETVLTVRDPDGLLLELVAHAGAAEIPPWADGPVPEAHAIRGFRGITLRERDPDATATLLTEAMNFTAASQGPADRVRFAVGAGHDAAVVDIVHRPDGAHGNVAAGSVHHVAWRARDEDHQRAWRSRLVDAGMDVTPVLDRRYFQSIYWREPGGALFEMATDPPGFTADETIAELGSSLRLPPWLEPRRMQIEDALPPLREPAKPEGDAR